MKTTIFAKVQKMPYPARNSTDYKRITCSYIFDVEGELNADAINEALESCVGKPIVWHVEDIKILATTHIGQIFTKKDVDDAWLQGMCYAKRELEKQCDKDKLINEIIAKQKGLDRDGPQNHQDSGHPKGGIVLEDFNGGEGFYKLHLDYLDYKQVEEIEKMVRVWNKEE